jgi:histidinol-phosphate aminotransferase
LCPSASASTPPSATKLFSGPIRNGYAYIPSESNCFLLDTERPGKEVIDAMATQNVFVGRIWPIMATCVRVTVGTQEEMALFHSAYQKVMRETTAFTLPMKTGERRTRRTLPS